MLKFSYFAKIGSLPLSRKIPLCQNRHYLGLLENRFSLVLEHILAHFTLYVFTNVKRFSACEHCFFERLAYFIIKSYEPVIKVSDEGNLFIKIEKQVNFLVLFSPLF